MLIVGLIVAALGVILSTLGKSTNSPEALIIGGMMSIIGGVLLMVAIIIF